MHTQTSTKGLRLLISVQYLEGVGRAWQNPVHVCTDLSYAAAVRSTKNHFIEKYGVAEKPCAASKDFKTAYVPFAPNPHEDLAEAVTHNLELETCVYSSFHPPLTWFGLCPIDHCTALSLG